MQVGQQQVFEESFPFCSAGTRPLGTAQVGTPSRGRTHCVSSTHAARKATRIRRSRIIRNKYNSRGNRYRTQARRCCLRIWLRRT